MPSRQRRLLDVPHEYDNYAGRGSLSKISAACRARMLFMALFADVLDHVEWKSGFRCDGLAMSVYNIIAVAMVGICTGVFNGLLAKTGYTAPEIINGVTTAAEQSAAVKHAITFWICRA